MTYSWDVRRERAYFVRRRYIARLYHDGVCFDDRAFYGNDGRTVRADAVRWAQTRLAYLAHLSRLAYALNNKE